MRMLEFRDYKEIEFNDGDILSAQMLKETYRYPREFLHITHACCSNGVISGLDFETRNGCVYLTAGIVKVCGKYFILPQAVNLEEWFKQSSLNSSATYCLCLVHEDNSVSGDLHGGFSRSSSLALKAEREKPEKALLLARYKYNSAVELQLPSLQKPDSCNDPFAEFTQASYLQLLDTEYAHPQGETTYHPLVFRAIKSYLEQKCPLSPYDFSLLLEIQNHGLVALSSLRAYVAASYEVSPASISDMTREKLFAEIVECLQKKPYCPLKSVEVSSNTKQEDDTKRVPRSMLI